MTAVDGIVLAGGASRRFGGEDKTAAVVAGRTLLERAVAALAGADRVVVVGPTLPAAADVRLVLAREDPAGSGPAAALAAGLKQVTADVVVLLAADLPHVEEQTVRALVHALVAADPEVAAVVPADADGRPQWLAAAYRTTALRAAVTTPNSVAGPTGRGPGLRDLLGGLRRIGGPRELDYGRLRDVDTPEDLSRARLEAWTRTVVAELDLAGTLGDLEVTRLVDTVLDVARDAAHTVARPAAPVTTFLLGLALGGAAAETSTGTTARLDALRARLTARLSEHEGA